MFFRATAARSALRAVSHSNASVARSSLSGGAFKAQLTTFTRATPTSLALATRKPVSSALVRYASSAGSRFEPIDLSETKVAEIEKTPSPATQMKDPTEEDVDMMAGVRGDVTIIKDTFSLQDVPKDALYLGMAGVVPYLVTSLQTSYLAWEMNNAAVYGAGHYISGETAQAYMHLLEPIQVGYGAVILSFLGAIHWGLEWAKYGGNGGMKRYAIGVAAPAVAWPTLLFPIEYALISQFFAFNFLYYADARAAVRGLTPSWYPMYRFVLTFVVGGSIIISLISREKISHHFDPTHGLADRVHALQKVQEEQAAKEEAEKREELAIAEATAAEE